MIFKKLFRDGPSDTLTVGELRVVLGHLQRLSASAGAKGAARDLAALSNALKIHENMSVDAFCADARTALSQQGRKSKPAKKTLTRGALHSSNDQAIRDYVAQLRDAGTNQQAFELAFARLKCDKSIRSQDAAEIARQYSLSVTKYKSTKAAHADIEKAFVRQARFENKLR